MVQQFTLLFESGRNRPLPGRRLNQLPYGSSYARDWLVSGMGRKRTLSWFDVGISRRATSGLYLT